MKFLAIDYNKGEMVRLDPDTKEIHSEFTLIHSNKHGKFFMSNLNSGEIYWVEKRFNEDSDKVFIKKLQQVIALGADVPKEQNVTIVEVPDNV